MDPAQSEFPVLAEMIANAPDAPPATDLIPINRESGVASVDARDLHHFLEVGKDFSTWITERIRQFDFSEGQDFSPISGKSSGGRPSKEYALSLDMAKELSMVERTPKGKQARQYFIECEKRLNQPFAIPATRAEALRLAADLEEKNQALTAKLEIAEPKAEALDLISNSHDAIPITQAAKLIGVPPKVLFAYMDANKWTYLSGGDRTPYQARIEQGYLTKKIHHFKDSDGFDRTSTQTVVFPKGIARLAQIFRTASHP